MPETSSKMRVFFGAIFVAVLFGGIGYFVLTGSNARSSISAHALVFENIQTWTPCPAGENCRKGVSVYSDGRVEYHDGNRLTERNIGTEGVRKMLETVAYFDLMTKDCTPAAELTDARIYTIVASGTTRTIKFPGCKADLDRVESFIPPID